MEKSDNGKPQVKVKKSLINSLLSKRSTKVEPHPFDENNVSGQSYRPYTGHLEQQSVSANSSPIKACRNIDKNQMWRRHNSNHHMNSIDSMNSTFMRATSKAPLATKNINNRLSHPFSLCCNRFDVNSVTPPVTASGTYDVLENQENVSKTDTDNLSNGHYKIVSTKVDVHSPLRTPTPTDSSNDHVNLSPTKRLPNDFRVNDTVPEQQSESPSTTPTERFAPAKPVFAEYQTKSIAMSACRSRFREKLLPPGTVLNATPEQHFSSPNISEKSAEKTTAPDHRNSRSYSYDILVGRGGADRPGSTDSLVKQSLMAAQVLHLIPTEKARERYVKNVVTLCKLGMIRADFCLLITNESLTIRI